MHLDISFIKFFFENIAFHYIEKMIFLIAFHVAYKNLTIPFI